MKSFIVALAFGVALPVSAFAQDAPPFLKAIEPQAAVSSAWQEWMAVFNPKGALDGKTKELIGLAVAAQIPCQYCVYAHTLGAKHAGATDEQIKEAVAASGLVRKMSTELNGNQYDMAEFKRQIDAAYGAMKTDDLSRRRGQVRAASNCSFCLRRSITAGCTSSAQGKDGLHSIGGASARRRFAGGERADPGYDLGSRKRLNS